MASPDSPDKKKNFWRLSLSKKSANRSRAASLNTDDNSEGFRLVLAGCQCGKSTLIHRLLDNKFIENDDPTIGISQIRKNILETGTRKMT